MTALDIFFYGFMIIWAFSLVMSFVSIFRKQPEESDMWGAAAWTALVCEFIIAIINIIKKS